MPHERRRLLAGLVAKSLRHSPVVGILGQRQTGKTTLLQALLPKGRYATLDDPIQLEGARGSPTGYLERGSGLFGIDECQLAPELFPALKEKVRLQKKPGQFLLTGSIRFTSRKLIRESLTGRIVSHELLPLCLAETNNHEPGDATRLLRMPLRKMVVAARERCQQVTESAVREHLLKGGLPGICFFRDLSVRRERFAAHLDTLLSRDLQLVFETTLPTAKIMNVLRYFARHQGVSISISDLGRQARISAPALQRLIPALEALFLIRRVETIGDRKKDRFFLEDQGMATFLGDDQPEMNMLRLVFSQCFAQMRYLYPNEGAVFCYETRGGARVPIVLDVAGARTGLIPLAAEIPDASAIAAAESFLGHDPKAVVAILTQGKEVAPIRPGIFVVPYRAVL